MQRARTITYAKGEEQRERGRERNGRGKGMKKERNERRADKEGEKSEGAIPTRKTRTTYAPNADEPKRILRKRVREGANEREGERETRPIATTANFNVKASSAEEREAEDCLPVLDYRAEDDGSLLSVCTKKENGRGEEGRY